MPAASIERGLRIVRGLFAWLHEVGYLAGNPWAAVATTLKSHTQFRTAASPEKGRREVAVARGVERRARRDRRMPAGERKARAVPLVRLGAMAGLRREELAYAMAQWVEAHGKGRMTLKIVGKGGGPARCRWQRNSLPRWATTSPRADCRAIRPMPAKDAAARQARRRDRPDGNGAEANRPGTARPTIALTPARIYAISRRLIEQAADAIEGQGEPKVADKLRRRARAQRKAHVRDPVRGAGHPDPDRAGLDGARQSRDDCDLLQYPGRPPVRPDRKGVRAESIRRACRGEAVIQDRRFRLAFSAGVRSSWL